MRRAGNGGAGRPGRKFGLAMAGGGPTGAVYEIGALRALDEVLEGVDFNDFHVYVGVSAGAFIGANLANGLTTAQMCRAIVKHDPGEHPFDAGVFFAPALKEIARRWASVPRLALESLWLFARNPRDMSLVNALTRLGRALPVGVFDNRPVRDYLERIYSIKGRTNDFRELDKHLIIIAADLDSGEAVKFGVDGFAHVPISVAVQASGALPGIYPPVEIDGRHYVDGVLLKTMHASVALDQGCDLLLGLNPLVPVDTADAVKRGVMRRGKLIDRGLPAVLSQSLRTMIRSRMTVGFAAYERVFKGRDVVLFEPPKDDYQMFFTNVFSFSSRRDVCEHAYQETRSQLRARREELIPLFARHGITVREDILDDRGRSIWDGVGLGRYDRGAGTLNKLDALLDRLEDALEEA